ncbi:hypothetical protein IGI04_036045 [Brassica rapa subsp. trilocularis]|uniref:Uncharacterized protein n=1 Tax=Brassica rapa subsp. trilocularis TaxID=1813537 RepID=A0ABQ7LF63_BRACM|nr:hypothetical protein IGI04_036045 [Brassica rapa subsp. trilocularis]
MKNDYFAILGRMRPLTRVLSLSAVTASELGLLLRQLFLLVPIEDFLLLHHWFVERRAIPSGSASGPSWMSVDILVGIVGDVAGIQVDVLDFIILRTFCGRQRTLRVSVLTRRSFPRGSRPIEWGCEVKSFPADLVVPQGRIARVLAVNVSTCLVKVANIFLNSSNAAALAGAFAADTSAAGVLRSVMLPPLIGVCMLSASSESRRTLVSQRSQISANMIYLGFDPFSSMLKGHFTRADHVEVDERKKNRSMRISAIDRYQEMPRQMKINIDRCTQVPSIDVETPDTRHFGFSRLKTQGQAKLTKCSDEFLT